MLCAAESFLEYNYRNLFDVNLLLTLWSDEWWHDPLDVGGGWGYEAAGNYGGHSGGGTCCGTLESI